MFTGSGRQGYMDRLSYTRTPFTGVQYQPKDYDLELNRIIRDSLFDLKEPLDDLSRFG